MTPKEKTSEAGPQAPLQASGGELVVKLAPAMEGEYSPSVGVPYSSQVFYPGICTLPGLPSTAVPVGRDNDGLPIGLQVLGPYLEDYTPLRFASLLEKAGLAGFAPPPDFA